ncbi:hypothetical protein W97_07412 [Coniosporium apollinis CBS 100218]|uniref:Transcriptional regulator n=1 Tax=Coniosporium apollinis (strain CBS 100218) TaxID=1168221 RepID=R7Z135_CONA1|nr:uncharacterized protein W97_07412 [Coniosporium apollinis CBS 100218]EON67915.1 hypothetical protein W97_07412 [Coniosporium apollinis CBS 100218]
MSDLSDSEDGSTRLPPEPRIEQALRQAVATISKSGNHEDLTVNRVRAAAVADLALPDGFFKSNVEWKNRSKDIITDEVKIQEAKEDTNPASPDIPVKKPNKRKTAPETGSRSKAKPGAQKTKAEPAPQKSRKRQSADVKPNARKRRKVSVSSEEPSEPPLSNVEDSSDAVSEPESVPQKSQPARKRQARKLSDDAKPIEASEDDGDEAQPAPAPIESDSDDIKSAIAAPAPAGSKNDDASESELSDVLDEAPAPKKARKKSGTDKATKSTKLKSSKAKNDSNPDPDEAEIRRLQGWLIKCGIRKLWHRELASYDTSRAKINHLKRMLKDAGMDGRYSAEKAKQIKEQRELAADLEAVQEGAKRWGQAGSEDDSGGKRPTRQLAKGLRNLDFLGSDDGEETD